MKIEAKDIHGNTYEFYTDGLTIQALDGLAYYRKDSEIFIIESAKRIRFEGYWQ